MITMILVVAAIVVRVILTAAVIATEAERKIFIPTHRRHKIGFRN